MQNEPDFCVLEKAGLHNLPEKSMACGRSAVWMCKHEKGDFSMDAQWGG